MCFPNSYQNVSRLSHSSESEEAQIYMYNILKPALSVEVLTNLTKKIKGLLQLTMPYNDNDIKIKYIVT